MSLLNVKKTRKPFYNLEGKVCLEIGVYKGDFSEKILSYNPSELYLVDCWEEQEGLAHECVPIGQNEQSKQDSIYDSVVERFIDDSRVKIVRARSDTAPEFFDDEFFDFIYIDANHTFEYCYNDIKLWFPKLKPCGAMAGHDYYKSSKWGDDVIRASNTFAKENSLAIHRLTRVSWGFIKGNSDES